MKRTVLIIVTALICGTVLMTGCEKRNPNVEGFDDIIGCWANPTNEYDVYPKLVICYERVTNLPDDSPSIKFLNDGTLIERKNAGWCGTPPITYSDFPGNWQVENSNKIKINVAYWGGMIQHTWKIVDITNTSLRIEINTEDIQYY